MKAKNRIVYRVLGDEIGAQLCVWCKDSISLGCCDGMSCKHKLRDKLRFVDNGGPFPGDDCWLFRADKPVELVADVVGIVLAENYDEWVICWDKMQVRGNKSVVALKEIA